MSAVDQGWALDDGGYDDDIWDDDPLFDDEPDEPDFGWDDRAWSVPVGRAHRQLKRRWRQALRRGHQAERRHRNDRFWKARNRPRFDADEPPF